MTFDLDICYVGSPLTYLGQGQSSRSHESGSEIGKTVQTMCLKSRDGQIISPFVIELQITNYSVLE